MYFSIAIIFLLGLSAGWLCKKLHLPALLGMLLIGVAIGPYALNLVDPSLLGISTQLRKIALTIILTRAGLSLNLGDLKRVGRPAVLMCFVPACFEMAGMLLVAPRLLHISLLDAAIMGAAIAAVSPAVIVPKMLKLMEDGWGTAQSIPQMILAGASVDDVFVIVMFSALTGLAQTGTISALSFIRIPISILLGIVAGWIVGLLMGKFFAKYPIQDTLKIVVFLSFACLLVTLEDTFPVLPFSALIAIMCVGISMQRVTPDAAKQLSAGYNQLWVAAEVMLFVLVGTTVNLDYALAAGVSAILLILAVLLFRMLGVFVCMLKTNLSLRERLFCMIAYLPKATVQAAIGGLPLAMGLGCGNIVLTVAVLSILITAPLGAFLIDLTYQRLLTPDKRSI